MSGKDIIEITMLYDLYSPLLTGKQKLIFELYYFDNLSLKEIGDEFSVTPQSVSDLLGRTVNKLNWYEERLKLLARDKKTAQILERLQATIDNDSLILDTTKNEIHALLNSINEQ